MYKLTNKADRRVGLPAEKHGGILLEIGETIAVSNEHRRELLKSKKTIWLISSGALVDEKVKSKSKSGMIQILTDKT
jgi:hypothetical protein